MKKHIGVYGILIAIFVAYNLFFSNGDEKTYTAVNILLASVVFLYIGFLAWILLRRMSRKK